MNRREWIATSAGVVCMALAVALVVMLWPTTVVVKPPVPVIPESVVKQMTSLEKRVAKLEKKEVAELKQKCICPPAVAAPSPTLPALPAPATPTVAPAPAPQPPAPALLIGQPQAYYNSWGWWLVDPNGSFHCPPVANPTSWTGGMKILVQRSGSPPYEAWAPACYR